MHARFTLAEVIFVAVLYLFAIGSARAVDAAQPGREKQHQITLDRDVAHHQGVPSACDYIGRIERDVLSQKRR